jgi:hypothetical protein
MVDSDTQIRGLDCPNCNVPSLSDSGTHWEGIRILRCLQCWHLFTEDYVERHWGKPVTLPNFKLLIEPEEIKKEGESWDLPWDKWEKGEKIETSSKGSLKETEGVFV